MRIVAHAGLLCRMIYGATMAQPKHLTDVSRGIDPAGYEPHRLVAADRLSPCYSSGGPFAETAAYHLIGAGVSPFSALSRLCNLGQAETTDNGDLAMSVPGIIPDGEAEFGFSACDPGTGDRVAMVEPINGKTRLTVARDMAKLNPAGKIMVLRRLEAVGHDLSAIGAVLGAVHTV